MESLDALLAIINTSVTDIKEVYKSEGADLPSLDKPHVPDPLEPKTREATDLVVNAALNLIALLRPPALSLQSMAFEPLVTASLSVANELNVAEILREAGPEGLHINDIAKRANTNAGKLGRLLRVLAVHHVFKETAPDVFTNNRLSSLLDTGKSVAQLLEDPMQKHENTSGFPSLISHLTHIGFKTGAFIPDYFEDRKAVDSEEPNMTPLNYAFGTSADFMGIITAPGNEIHRVRLNAGMAGRAKTMPPAAILERFPWSSLEKGKRIVDVGGGVGSSTLALAKQFPDLNFVVQDIPDTIEDAKKYWANEYPSAISSGRVSLQAHDFFSPQPVKDADIFLLRIILHDWSATYCKKILRHLREAAGPDTKVVLVEHILRNALSGKQESGFGIPGEELLPTPPFPLLVGSGDLSYQSDIHMLSLANGAERTVGAFVDVVEGTGWKVAQLIPGNDLSSVVLACA